MNRHFQAKVGIWMDSVVLPLSCVWSHAVLLLGYKSVSVCLRACFLFLRVGLVYGSRLSETNKWMNANTCILLKLLHRFQPNFARDKFIPPDTRPGWSKHAQNKFKMAGGHHFEKNIKNRRISARTFSEWCTLTLLTVHTAANSSL